MGVAVGRERRADRDPDAMTAHVLIAGGGPAGLAAAGVLARGGLRATVLEAGVYPRSRICGEFLSPDAAEALAALGLPRLPDDLGAPRLTSVRATASDGGHVRAEIHSALPGAGRGVSRFDLDLRLAEAARDSGARVIERCRVDAVDTDAAAVRISAEHGEFAGDALVLATGRLARPRGTGEEPRRPRRRWVAVKLHVRGPVLPDATELHFVPGAYVGLNEVSCNGERRVNVCALASQATWDACGRRPNALLEHIARESPAFARRWWLAVPVDDAPLTAAGFGFEGRPQPTDAPRPALVCGDAAALIAPFAGDGQAMALSAGVSAARALLAVAHRDGGVSADGVRFAARAHAGRFRREMRVRLVAGRALQAALLRPRAAVALLRTVGTVRGAPAWIFRLTRGRVTQPDFPGGVRPL
jgi:flavin-dependent dehydrogenase